MSAFKGLIPRVAISSQTVDPIIKKAEESRRCSQLCLDFFLQIAKLQEAHFNSYQRVECPQELTNPYHKNLWMTIVNIAHPQNPIFKVSNQIVEQTGQICTQTFTCFNEKIAYLDQAIVEYKDEQQNVVQMGKKYLKIQKNMIHAIQMYKMSFTDVNLIYNMDQKIKRFSSCQNLYNLASQEVKAINQKCQHLFTKKINIFQIYSSLAEQSNKTIRRMGGIYVQKVKQIMNQLSQFSINTLSNITVFETSISNIEPVSFLKINTNKCKLEYFHASQQIDVSKCLPLFVEYHHLVKQQYLQNYNFEIESYIKVVEQKLEQRRTSQKKLFDTVSNYFRNLQKVHCVGSKQILISFQKKRKRIAECFGNRFVTFLKAINSVLQISAGLSQKLIRSINPILCSIQKILNQDTKIAKVFIDESKTYPQRFMMKKETNKNNKKQVPGVQIDVQVETFLLRKQISQKANFLKHLMSGFTQKIDKNCNKVISYYNDLMIEVKNCTNELNIFCKEYQQMYFGVEQYEKNLQKYRIDLQNNLIKYNQYFATLPLQQAKKDTSKIIFNAEFSKIQDFKKIKKLVVGQKVNNNQQNTEVCEAGSENDRMSLNKKTTQNLTENFAENEKQAKHADFLKTKITFKENQKLLKTSSCALSQKIVLQGRLYLTSQRVCFYSNFNSQNIFFGRTFIQFPKSDIKKIQKRTNSFFLDNSMSFTTVNGQIFFTSFFSRNELYDLICKTYNISMDEHVYEYVENDETEIPQFLIDYEQSDDIKADSLELRKSQIDKLINSHPYIQASSVQIFGQGLTAFKVFKIFYDDVQFSLKGRKYQSFLKYEKDLIGQKDIQIEEWNPPLATFINKSNIKEQSPLVSTRKLKYTVPMANTGVPFMPKTAKSQEIQNLYFYSKHKFLIESTVVTTGAPYTDTFKVQLRTIVESSEDGKCTIQLKFHINFVKNTMMKSVIESKSKQETIASSKVWTNEVKKYFTINSNKKKNGKKNEGEDNAQIEEVQKNEEQQIKVIGQKLKVAQGLGNKWKMLSIASILLNIILAVLLLGGVSSQ